MISVVDICGVLVMVWVVVVAEDADSDAVAEKDGSTKFSGASAGSSPPLTNITAADEDADDGDAGGAGPDHRARRVVPGLGRLVAAELIDEFVLVEFVVKVGACHGHRY